MSVGPAVADILYYASLFRNDMLARNKGYPGVCPAAVAIRHHIAELYERMPPVCSFEAIFGQILKPCLVKVVKSLGILLSGGIDELERAGHYESDALVDTSGKVVVDLHIVVNVI